MPAMDHGHYNCRDYYISPHLATTTITNTRSSLLYRHESFDELEQRCRSPASLKPPFPLLKLPVELRQQIFRYLLPHTIEHSDPNPLTQHARTFSAVQKRGASGMAIPPAEISRRSGPGRVVWKRGNINLLRVSRQLHDECAEMLYGDNTFLLFVTYSGITFRFSWLIPSGFAPNRRYPFLELLPGKYLALVKRLVVNVDHVDSYTGMIKFNVSGKGLVHGLRGQVLRLVSALQPPRVPAEHDGEENSVDGESGARRLTKISVHVSNGNAILDQIKNPRLEHFKSPTFRKGEGSLMKKNVGDVEQIESDAVRKRKGGAMKIAEDVEEMLEPFGRLRAGRIAISGAVTESFSQVLEERMMSTEKPDGLCAADSECLDLEKPAQLCVYGNDL